MPNLLLKRSSSSSPGSVLVDTKDENLVKVSSQLKRTSSSVQVEDMDRWAAKGLEKSLHCTMAGKANNVGISCCWMMGTILGKTHLMDTNIRRTRPWMI